MWILVLILQCKYAKYAFINAVYNPFIQIFPILLIYFNRKTEILPYRFAAAGQWHREKQWDEDLIIMIFHNPYHKQFFSYKFWLGFIYKLCIAKDSLDGNYSDVVPRKPRATIAFCAKWINSNISIIITLLVLCREKLCPSKSIDSYALCLVVLSKQIPSFSPARFHTTCRKSLIILLKVIYLKYLIWNHNNQTIIGFLTAMVFTIVFGLWPFTFYNYFPICQLGKIWFCCHITQTIDSWHPF